ncbi:hypothetical protein N3K66_000030 [Trichothecium roseum]|uniref:Uncharacterized protein n=1 Tax=Trichothecium roseum TaxID=47278 RepID=A0ACC0VC95_9HYPO|nr:hypothetical protein N3K66_000030 [Trichothecium roseum]
MCQIHRTYTICTCKRATCPQKNGGLLTCPSDVGGNNSSNGNKNSSGNTGDIEIMYHVAETRVDGPGSRPCHLRRGGPADVNCANRVFAAPAATGRSGGNNGGGYWGAGEGGSSSEVYSPSLCRRCRDDGLCWK